jgi:hypothetical protein
VIPTEDFAKGSHRLEELFSHRMYIFGRNYRYFSHVNTTGAN